MKYELLGAAMARCLSEPSGLVAAYLPEGINRRIVESIVRTANSLRPQEPSFAILVRSGADDLSDITCPEVSPGGAIRYRQDDRLAVVFGRHPDLKSFVQSFRQVVAHDFPGGTNSTLTLDRLAEAALDEVLNAASIQPAGGWDRVLATKRLATCFEQLMEAHIALKQGSFSWNVYWFAHVSTGLSALTKALIDLIEQEPATPLEEALLRLTFASFSLPFPQRQPGLSPKGKTGTAIAEALSDWWADADSIAATLNALATHPDTDGALHPLARVKWDDYGKSLAAQDNALLAFALHSGESPNRVQAFAALTERQFFNPLSIQQENQSLRFSGASHESLGLNVNSGPYFVAGECVDVEGVECIVHSVPVLVSLPFLDPDSPPTIDAEDLVNSGVSLKSNDPAVTWEGELEIEDDGSLRFSGRFVRRVGESPFAMEVKPLAISLFVPEHDALEGKVARKASATIFFTPPVGTGVAIFRVKAKSFAHLKSFGPERFLADGTAQGPAISETLEIEGGQRYDLIVWGAEAVALDGKALLAWDALPGFCRGELQSSGLHEVVANDLTLSLSVPHPKKAHISPVVAAMTKSAISAEDASLQTTNSLRGRLEDLLSRQVLAPDWLNSMGHLILPSDRTCNLSASAPLPPGAFLAPPEVADVWSNTYFHFQVAEEVVNSEQASAFRQAFVNLQIGESMTRDDDGTKLPIWPSRVSWKHLWEKQSALADYLTTYAALVDYARSTGSVAALFWASYPFSASVWGLTGEGCKAVLLSPLHPLRLAWLAATESTMADAKQAHRLGGTVEGWNLPILGPRSSLNGRMLAVPLDNGEDQIFLGWSMLVKASIDEPEHLDLPTKVAGLSSPGVSASGLNAAAVEAALRDYRRVNPHVSTLTIDLASTTPVVRLEEIDNAVLAATDLWNQEAVDGDGVLSGGIRVRDSLDRLGDSPREQIGRLIAKQSFVPVSWARYRPAVVTESCNLRLLQDSGIRVSVAGTGGANRGVIGPVPIRRFEATPPRVVGGKSESSPAIMPEQGWEPFTHALCQMEGADSQPLVVSQLYRALLVDDRADWTVSGETLMSPSAMAKLLGAGGNAGQMLWEWRPPFLESKSRAEAAVPLLERRPFVSVARVPGGFRAKLKEMLSEVSGAPASDAQVNGLLNLLGARGVGLSSLTAMGGTHTAGAIGFYLAMRLMELAQVDGVDQIVMPIDACDSFLKALGGGDGHGDFRRRADLLVMRLYEDTIVMSPIEIKFYGLLASEPPSMLPPLESYVLDESIAQLASTMSLLEKVEANSERWLADSTCGDAVLWSNGLLTLVDSGIRLRDPDLGTTEMLPDRLRNLANGNTRVVVGRPVVCFFGHAAKTIDDGAYTKHVACERSGADDLGPVGALISNPGEVLKELDLKRGPILDAWREVIDWACMRPTPLTPAGPEPSGASENSEDLWVEEPSGETTKLSGGHTTRTDSADTPETTGNSDDECSGGIRFPVGRFLESVGSAYAEYWPSNTDLNQMNIGVVGDLGTGKTQLLKSLMLKLRRAASNCQPSPLSILVFDYKSDYQDEGFLEAVGGKVLRPEGIPLNVFALTGNYTPLLAYQKAQAFIDVITKIYGGVGPLQRNNLATAITQLFAERDGAPPTLAAVLDRYVDLVGAADSVVAVLNPFVIGQVFSDDPSHLKSFETLLNDQVLVVALNELGNDQNMKNALVVLFLNLYYDYMLRQKKWPFETNADGIQQRRLNSFLLVDEATNIMQYEFPVLMSLMLQGREFGTGVVLGSQYLSHFKVGQTNYGQPLLTWFIHRVPTVTKQQLIALGITSATDEITAAIPKLGLHQALYRSLGVPGRLIRGTPFYEEMEGVD